MQRCDQRLSRRWRPGRADAIIGVHGLASFCYGMVLPYTAIYLAGKPAVGTTGVVIYYASSGCATVVVTLVLAAGWIRLAPVALGIIGNALWLVGYLSLAVAASWPLVAAGAVGIGAGQGCFLAAVVPVLNSLIAPADRRRVFGRRYAVLNVTLAAGALLAGLIITAAGSGAIRFFFIVNAAGIVPVAVALALFGRPRRARAGGTIQPGETGEPSPPGGAAGAGGGLATLALGRLVLPVAAFQLVIYLFGFSQFEATAPLVSRRLMHVPLYGISLMLTVNVLVIALTQRAVTRRLERHPEITGLRAGMALWAAAYCVAGAAAIGPPGTRLAGMLAFAVVFALGECAYSCSFHPWLISWVPDRELARASALANSAMGIGTLAGPSIGVALALSGSAPAVWLSLAGCTSLVVAAAARLARRAAAATRLPASAA
ncbi:MAG TPA: MFS transporter [Streptosporangiaceae bacterium]|jgi:MFS family permease